jgi:hypothetical protein
MTVKMSIDEYQRRVAANPLHSPEAGFLYSMLGMAGEMGELFQKLLAEVWPDPETAKGTLEAGLYIGLKRAADAGVVCEMLKKTLRDRPGAYAPDQYYRLGRKVRRALEVMNKEGVLKEHGDVMFYSAYLADELGYKINKVYTTNMDKFTRRRAAGRVHGSGDDR